MFNWRNALVLGVIFIVVGIIYFAAQVPQLRSGDDRLHQPDLDLAGVVMLSSGVAMVFGLIVLIRGSREL